MSVISMAWASLDAKQHTFWNNFARRYVELGGSVIDVVGDNSYRSVGYNLFAQNAKHRFFIYGDYGDFSPLWILDPAISSINPTIARDALGFIELTDIVTDYNNAPYLYENRLLKARKLCNPSESFSKRKYYKEHPI